MFETEEEKQQFLEVCKYIGSVLSLNQIFKRQSSAAKAVCYLKHFCYFLFMVMFPLRAKFNLCYLFLLANVSSLINRKLTTKSKDSFIHTLLSDEEAMHAIWFLTYILLGQQLQFFVDIMFLLWSVLNTSELLDYLIMNTDLPIVGLFAGFVKLTQDNLIEIVVFKNYMEVLIVPFSLVAWMFSLCAPVVGIILVQYVRIKFMGSAFTKRALVGIDGALQ